MTLRSQHADVVEHGLAAVADDEHALVTGVTRPAAVDLLRDSTRLLHVRVGHVAVCAVDHVNVTGLLQNADEIVVVRVEANADDGTAHVSTFYAHQIDLVCLPLDALHGRSLTSVGRLRARTCGPLVVNFVSESYAMLELASQRVPNVDESSRIT